MSLITAPEVRSRHAFLDEAQQQVAEAMAIPSMITAIGETAVQRIVKVNDLLFVPNIRNGKMYIPSRYSSTDAVPYFALEPGEVISYSPRWAELTPIQKEHLKEQLDIFGFPNVVLDDLTERLSTRLIRAHSKWPEDKTLQIRRSSSGFVVPSAGAWRVPGILLDNGKPINFLVRGRPFMGLNYLDRDRRSKAVVLIHELIHADQNLEEPPLVDLDTIDNGDNQLSHELEAHHYTDRTLTALISAGLYPEDETQYYDDSIAKEQLREQVADPVQPFAPLPILKHAFQYMDAHHEARWSAYTTDMS